MKEVPAFSTDEQIEASIKHLASIKQAMKDGRIARTEADMKGPLPKLMFSERTADELMQAVLMIKSLRERVHDLEQEIMRLKAESGGSET